MSTAPSQRRNLPRPCAAQTHAKDGSAPSTATARSVGGVVAVEAGDSIKAVPIGAVSGDAARSNRYVFRKSGEVQPQQAATTTRTASYPQQQQQRPDDAASSATQSNARSEGAYFTRPAPATFPWSARPMPQPGNYNANDMAHGEGDRLRMGPSNNNCAGTAGVAAGTQPTYVDLSATPEKSRRGRLSPPPSPRASASAHFVDASGEAAAQQPADSSMVFAMSEDNELKVLASRVGPSATVNRVMLPPGTTQRRLPGAAPTELPVVPRTTTAGTAPSVSAASQVQPHTPGVDRRLRDAEADGAERDGVACVAKPAVVMAAYPPTRTSTRSNSGASSAPPQQQQQQQLQHQPQHQPQHQHQQPAAKVNRSSAGMPMYRTNAHELPSPPALHVCPGGIPGVGLATSSNPLRWTSMNAPSVALSSSALHSAASYASLPSQSQAATRGNAAGTSMYAHTTATTAASTTRSGVSSAAPEGSNPRKSLHGKSLSADGRSQHSGTPPPPSSSSACAAAAPVAKNFSPAQLEGVMRDVREELYLNYSAVPIPADMINRGDTEERRRRMEQRQKQIAYGKETEGYAKYTTLVPRVCDREYHNPLHALTPRPEYDCSKRQFDRVLNAWRRQLHQWDDCDLDNPDAKFLPAGTATLLDLTLAVAPSAHTPTTNEFPPPPPQSLQPSGVLHSIAHVAAMAHDSTANHNAHTGNGNAAAGAEGSGENNEDDDDAGASHTRSPVFTGSTPTSGLYSSGLSVHLNSGRAAALTAAACTPSRPQLPEGAEGPQVDDAFFLHMNSGNSRIASPFHPTYSGSGHVANGNHHNNINNSSMSSSSNANYGGGNGTANGRSSTNSYYHQFMRNGSYAHHNGGTPGNNFGTHTGLTPAHRPPSRSNVPHHITAIFGCEYELMTPSGPGSPSGMPHHPRSGGSPYRLADSWMPNRRSPTYAHAAGHHVGASSNIIAANGTGTMVMTGTRGESPPQATSELALIPSTSQSSSGGFAQSPYGFRVHSPVQPQQQPQQHPQQQQQQQAYVTPLTRSQSRPGMTAGNALVTSPSRSPIGLPPQQPERVAIATTMAAAVRSRRGSGLGPAPMTWTPPNSKLPMRPSPHTPQLNLSATPTASRQPDA